MGNKYADGTPARQGDVVLADDCGRYVVVDPIQSDGFVFLAHIENPTHFTREAPVNTCQKQKPDGIEQRRAADVLKRVKAAK